MSDRSATLAEARARVRADIDKLPGDLSPDFDFAVDDGRHLEGYPASCHRIVNETTWNALT